MHALRHLGNDAVHGGADPDALSKHDRELVHNAELLLVDVLDEVYEMPAQRAARRHRVLRSPEET